VGLFILWAIRLSVYRHTSTRSRPIWILSVDLLRCPVFGEADAVCNYFENMLFESVSSFSITGMKTTLGVENNHFDFLAYGERVPRPSSFIFSISLLLCLQVKKYGVERQSTGFLNFFLLTCSFSSFVSERSLSLHPIWFLPKNSIRFERWLSLSADMRARRAEKKRPESGHRSAALLLAYERHVPVAFALQRPFFLSIPYRSFPGMKNTSGGKRPFAFLTSTCCTGPRPGA
jgi:hypothetical protein